MRPMTRQIVSSAIFPIAQPVPLVHTQRGHMHASPRERFSDVLLQCDAAKEAHHEEIDGGTDYLPADSDAFRAWVSTQPRPSALLRASLFVAIGALVGLTAFTLRGIIDGVAAAKVAVVRAALTHQFIGLAWLFNALYSVGLVAMSAELVLRIAPSAAGSGVPDVMAALNGCKLPYVFTWRTASVKMLSAAFAVGSGLPVGPEGPVIFLGSAIGALVSQGTGFLNRSAVARRLWPFARFRNSKDKRDFMTAGAAAGVAAAFSAPLGGLLFVAEDVASTWSKDSGFAVFYCCMSAVFATALVDSLRGGDALARHASILFEVIRPVRSHIMAHVIALGIGLLCGSAAAAFTSVTLWWDRHVRGRFVANHRRRRLAEPCIYMLLFLTLAIVLPAAFPCRESGCVVAPDGGLLCRDGSAIAKDLYGDVASGSLRERAVEESVEYFTCSASHSPPTTPPTAISGTGGSNTTRINGNSEPPAPLRRRYNELATLLHVTGDDAIRHLFSRQTHLEFGYASLATFYLLYSAFAALTAGSCISSGLLIPMLLMGATMGRFCGLLAVAAATHLGYSAADLLASDEWAWIDPGVFAVIGAAAFLGGGLRQALSVTVIVMELTGEVHLLLPIMLACASAKLVSEALLTDSLYHAILRARGAPYLPSELAPALASRLEVVSVRLFMTHPVVCVPDVGPLTLAMSALHRGSFHAFPVCNAAGSFVGLISREHLRRVVARAMSTSPGDTMRPLTYLELEGRAGLDGPREWPEHDDGATCEEDGDSTPLLDVSDGMGPDGSQTLSLDLGPYTSRCVAMPADCSALRTYIAFRTLGLRHLPVVDRSNRVVGIIARAELLPDRLQSCLDAHN